MPICDGPSCICCEAGSRLCSGKAKRQYLVTCKVSRYRLLASHDSFIANCLIRYSLLIFPHREVYTKTMAMVYGYLCCFYNTWPERAKYISYILRNVLPNTTSISNNTGSVFIYRLWRKYVSLPHRRTCCMYTQSLVVVP